MAIPEPSNIFINVSNISKPNLSELYLNPFETQKYFVEELCQPFIQNLSKIYLTVAIYNVIYSFTWLWLKNRKDKILLDFTIEDHNIVITIGSIVRLLDTIFFLLNFFVIGYWYVLQNPSRIINLPFVKWFT